MKINYKQPKFVLPLIVLPFIFILNYLLLGFFSSTEKQTSLETKEELNTNIPNPDKKSLVIKDKMEAQKEKYKDFFDISAVDSDVGENEINSYVGESIYTEAERDSILKYQDSINKLKELFTKHRENPFFLNSTEETNNKRISEKKSFEEQKRILEKKMLDSLLNPQKYLTINDIETEELVKDKKEKIFTVKKLENKNKDFFNTLENRESIQEQIEALIDEKITVLQGSRVRIKTNTDIIIDNIIIPKFSYIYGLVTGFRPERILITINSILVKGKIYKVNLEVYDLDGMQGLYIRNSKFVEFSKEMGSSSIDRVGSGLGQSNQQRSVLNEVIKEVTRATAQTTAKLIRKNKAHLKYNTNLYLINKSNE